MSKGKVTLTYTPTKKEHEPEYTVKGVWDNGEKFGPYKFYSEVAATKSWSHIRATLQLLSSDSEEEHEFN